MAEPSAEYWSETVLDAPRQEVVEAILAWMEAQGFKPKPLTSERKVVGVSIRHGGAKDPRKARTLRVGIDSSEEGLLLGIRHQATPRFGKSEAASLSVLEAECASLVAELRERFAPVAAEGGEREPAAQPAVELAEAPERPVLAATPDELDAISEPLSLLPEPAEQARLDEDLLIRMWFGEGDDLDSRMRAAVSVAATIAQLEGLKTFPAVATKVLQLLDEAEFSMNQVSAAIHEDPSLAAAVLRLANSSLYAGDNPVADLRTALVRLGADAVAEAVAAVATMGLFPPRSALAREIRNHCAGTGALFRHLALDFMPQRGSGTFLAGLLHDVGKMLLIDSAEFDYSGANGAAALRFDGIWMEERRLLAYDHAILGGQVLKRWNIPQPIPRLVAMHHQPGRAASFSDIGSLVALLRVADRLEHELRERPEDYEEIVGPLAESADFTETGVTEQWLAENWVRLYQIRADAFSLFRT